MLRLYYCLAPQLLQNFAFGGMGFAQFTQNPPPGDGGAAIHVGRGGGAAGRGGSGAAGAGGATGCGVGAAASSSFDISLNACIYANDSLS